MKVFVTGASGFIGRVLAAALRERGDRVCGVDLVADPTADVVAGDISIAGPWQQHAMGCDVVIHTAAIVSNSEGMDTQWRINTLGTRRALDAAVRGGVPKFVYLSSVRAFSDAGFPNNVTEAWPVRPDGNPYVDTKIASEQVVLQAHAAGEIDATIVRPGDVYGPGSRPWTIIPIHKIKKNQFMLPAMGKGIFSPVYVDDLVAGVIVASAHPDSSGQVFTISGGNGVECRDFFGHYYRMLGKRGPMVLPTGVVIPAVLSFAGVARIARLKTEVNPISIRYFARTGTYSIDKARRVLGFEPKIDLDEGMALTQAWLVDAQLL